MKKPKKQINIIALLQRLDTLVLLRKPITHEALDRLFYIFKIKVRSPAVVEYLTAMRPTVATGSVG